MTQAQETQLLVAALVARMLDRAHKFNTEVLEFQPPMVPTTLSDARLKASLEAFKEEDTEFTSATMDGDVLEAADALIDGIYFRLGRLVEMGVPPAVVFDEVQKANMGKVPGDLSKRPGWNGKDAVKPEGWTGPDHTWLLSFTMANLQEYLELKAEAEQREQISPVWKRLQELREAKGADYNNIPGGRDAYFPYGHMSYGHMVNTKCLRIQSLLNSVKAGKKVNFESLLDTVEDLVNYATYWAEAMRDGRLTQDGK